MLLQYIKNINQIENESDYDTAVDMTHYTFQKNEYFFETPKGVQLIVSSMHESSHTFIEPAPNKEQSQIPADTSQKNSLKYNNFQDESSESLKTSYHIEVVMPLELYSFSVENFKTYLKNDPLFNEYNFINSDQYIEPNLEYPQCSKEDIISLLNNIQKHNLRKNDFFEVPLTDTLQEQLNLFEIKAEHIIKNNLAVLDQNKINRTEAQKLIDVIKLEENVSNQSDIEKNKEVESKESFSSTLLNKIKKTFKR